jgi:hypothetical protein
MDTTLWISEVVIDMWCRGIMAPATSIRQKYQCKCKNRAVDRRLVARSWSQRCAARTSLATRTGKSEEPRWPLFYLEVNDGSAYRRSVAVRI